MLRFQEDTARHLFRMQIIGPDGTPIESPEQLARPRLKSQEPQPMRKSAGLAAGTPANSAHGPSTATNARRAPASTRSDRAPSTTIDALEKEFQKKKQKELDHARAASTATADTNGAAPRRTGEKVGRNDECPCGSGKKYKKCHGADA